MDEINPYTPPGSPLVEQRAFVTLQSYALYTWGHITYAILVLLFSLFVLLTGRHAGHWTQLVSCLMFLFPVVSAAQLSGGRNRLFLFCWVLQFFILLFLLQHAMGLASAPFKLAIGMFFIFSNALSLLGSAYFYWQRR